jgi:hypothetical protein
MQSVCPVSLPKDFDFKTAREETERSSENKLWVMNNIDKLREKYGDKYIAVDSGKVLISASTIDEILDALRKKKVRTAFVAIEFVTKESIVWIL